jgi:hypothetical protein
MATAELLPGTLDVLILKAVSLGKLHGYGVLLRIERDRSVVGSGARRELAPVAAHGARKPYDDAAR